MSAMSAAVLASMRVFFVFLFFTGECLVGSTAPTGRTAEDIVKVPEALAKHEIQLSALDDIVDYEVLAPRDYGFGLEHREGFLLGKTSHGQKQLLARWLLDRQGAPVLCMTYEYSENSIVETLYGQLTSVHGPKLQIDELGLPIDNGVESYQTIYLFNERGLLEKHTEETGKEISYRFVSETDRIFSSRMSVGGQPLLEIMVDYDENGEFVDTFMREFQVPKNCMAVSPTFESFSSTAYYVGRNCARSSGRAVIDLVSQLYDALNLGSLGGDLYNNPLVSEAFLILMGCNAEEHRCGVIGYGEANDEVRITHINGILNDFGQALKSAKNISEVHGGVNVHYIHNSTDGWTWDIIGALLCKAGVTTLQARHLARTWKQCIDELGGIGSGGKILHYAHSLGGADTLAALDLMEPEERDMLIVRTFGSPTMIPADAAAEVHNYVAHRDGVGLIGVIFDSTNVTWVGSSWGVPFIDHYLTSDSYQVVIQAMGTDFTEKYGKVAAY